MEDIKKRRERFETLGAIYPKAPSVKTEQVLIAGVNCYWLTPVNANPKKIVVYLHGGAFAVGSIRSHEALVSHFAVATGANILFVDYSLAPENPFPAAPDDVFAVYTELLNSYPGYEIDFIGDSAGGGLIVYAVAQMLKQKVQPPDSAVLISPWISLHCDNPSHEENRAIDPVLSREYAKASAADYIGDSPLGTGSPENVQLSKFPPVLIVVGSNEILLDDSRNFYDTVKQVQPDATLTIYENQNHVWPLSGIDTDASQRLLGQVAEFLNAPKN
jgi:monoterpene epsilon-lactone hydrolase